MGLIIQTRQKKVAQQLRDAAVKTAMLDARVLMMHVLNISIEELLMAP